MKHYKKGKWVSMDEIKNNGLNEILHENRKNRMKEQVNYTYSNNQVNKKFD